MSSIVCSTATIDDHSRVILNTLEDIDGSDYINASWIDVSTLVGSTLVGSTLVVVVVH